jgi:hypothetical protein
VKGLLTLVESSSRRFFAALRMTRGGFFNSPTVTPFDAGVKTRHDRRVELAETMLVTADGLRLTAYGPDEDGIRIPEGASHGQQSCPTAVHGA